MNIYQFERMLLLIFLALFFQSCSDDSSDDGQIIVDEVKDDIVVATVNANSPLRITAHNILISGKVINNGNGNVKERGVCFSLDENVDIEENHQIASMVKGSGEFQVDIQSLEDGETYFLKLYAINEKGIGYSNVIEVTTPFANPPIFESENQSVAGAQDIFFHVNVLESGDGVIEEIGVVYGKTENPTIENNFVNNENLEQNYVQRITGLDPETSYYCRPYIVSRGNTIYGITEKIKTIKPGNFTFWMRDVPENANQETIDAYSRIRNAFENAVYYYNNFTSIEKHVTVNYNPSVPTADGSFSGNIRVGTNQGYQRTGTAMHEMAHTVGIGTHSVYWDLMNGSWAGANAPRILKVMTAGDEETVSGDGTHFWPFGINGAHEDTGEEMLYIIHAMVMQGFKLDGLPSN